MVDVEGKSLLLANVEGVTYAASNICTHQEAYLSEGKLVDHTVVCPLHASQFDLRTGEVDFPPATEPLGTFKVEIREDYIFIEI